MTAREMGPWDESEVDFSEGLERLDLGGLLVLASPGVDVQVQADQATGVVTALTFAQSGAAVQVQPYAAPKSGGMWDEVRGQIKGSITKSGGLVEEVAGPFGVELQSQVTGADGAMQPARFAGIEGPRWFVRAVFLGAAVKAGEAATTLEGMVRNLVVVRGGRSARAVWNAALAVIENSTPSAMCWLMLNHNVLCSSAGMTERP